MLENSFGSHFAFKLLAFSRLFVSSKDHHFSIFIEIRADVRKYFAREENLVKTQPVRSSHKICQNLEHSQHKREKEKRKKILMNENVLLKRILFHYFDIASNVFFVFDLWLGIAPAAQLQNLSEGITRQQEEAIVCWNLLRVIFKQFFWDEFLFHFARPRKNAKKTFSLRIVLISRKQPWALFRSPIN